MDWQLLPRELSGSGALAEALLSRFEQIYRDCFQGEPGINENLPVELRAWRRVDEWHLGLLLAPWMLARVYIPDTDPGLSIPGEWSAAVRRVQPYQAIGPQVEFGLLGATQRACLNYDSRIGHYLLLPLALSMAKYRDADMVFREWDEVIRTRDENMRRAAKNCPTQREISRREFLSRGWRDSTSPRDGGA